MPSSRGQRGGRYGSGVRRARRSRNWAGRWRANLSGAGSAATAATCRVRRKRIRTGTSCLSRRAGCPPRRKPRGARSPSRTRCWRWGWRSGSIPRSGACRARPTGQLVWDCHWPCACVVSVFSFALTSARSDLISSPIPCPTWTWVRVSIEARRAAASWHSADAGLGAADEGAADEGAAEVVDGLLPLDGVPLDPQAAASSAAPAATATVCHRGGLIAVTRLMLPASSPVGRRASPARGYLAG